LAAAFCPFGKILLLFVMSLFLLPHPAIVIAANAIINNLIFTIWLLLSDSTKVKQEPHRKITVRLKLLD